MSASSLKARGRESGLWRGEQEGGAREGSLVGKLILAASDLHGLHDARSNRKSSRASEMDGGGPGGILHWAVAAWAFLWFR